MTYLPFASTISAVFFGLVQPVHSQTTEIDLRLGMRPQDSARAAIASIDTAPRGTPSNLEVQSLIVPALPGENAAGGETAEAPFAIPNTMILTLQPDITEDELKGLIEERGLVVIDTFPNLNAIHVETDLSSFFSSQITDDNRNDALLRGTIAAAESFKAEEGVIAASPDLLFGTQDFQEQNVVSAMPLPRLPSVEAFVDVTTAETNDWGIADIEADQLWTETAALDGGLLGVMDVGFHRHEDLVFLGPDNNNPANDHGNHVAGIACARHNGIGVRGVVPNCLVLPRSGDFFPVVSEGGDILGFLTRFSMIMRTLDDFVSSSQQVRVFNVSLGYNWMPNFGINIDSLDGAQFRQLVALQGENLLNALVRADERGAIFASAAGNDSRGLAQPIRAQFSSPFNWAAVEARQRGLATNALIVEAHDVNGDRAPFSNVEGNISCPGVQIVSTIARDVSGQPVKNAYGTMSGTSMASPYCAGGALLLMLLRPNYRGSEIADCMTASAAASSSGAPMLRLSQAISACPPRS